MVLRDAGAPANFTAPELGTGGKMTAAMALLIMGVATAPLQPILMRTVHINVALNAGRPPPGWKGMTRFRGR